MNKKSQYRVLIQTDGNNNKAYIPQKLMEDGVNYDSFYINPLHIVSCPTREDVLAYISKDKEKTKEEAAARLYLKNKNTILKEEYEYIE